MLDRLPTELVLAVLEYLAPPLNSIWTVSPKRDELYAVMRVSTRLYSLANPIFWREVWIDSAVQAMELEALSRGPTAGHVLQHVEAIQVGRMHHSPPTLAHIRSLLTLLPRVKRLEVGISTEDKVEMRVFAEFDLEALWLRNKTLSDSLPSSTFTVLTELSLNCITMAQKNFVNPETCPALRALSLHGIINPSVYPTAPFLALSDRMVAQLDLLQLDILNEPDRLVTLETKPENHATLLGDVTTTLKICEERGVEVVWHALDTTRPGAVSPSLWRWAKNAKAEGARQDDG
ncbi:hypothetical protein JCM10207_006358 [Rhodosporidiobolus poonsookiae]